MFCPFITRMVTTPTTCPLMLKTGLPELPCEMGAVICTMRPKLGTSRTAETMPSATDPSSLSGLPMTKMRSPSSGAAAAVSTTLARSEGISTLKTARSPSSSRLESPATR
jgi:hypothetical protein